MAQYVTGNPPKPLGHDTVTVSNTAVGLTAANIPAAATRAAIFVETAGIRFWLAGADPTAAVGYPVAANGIINLESRNEINGFKAIRSGGSDATLSVVYEAD